MRQVEGQSMSWEWLSDLQESYLVEVVEYAAACDLQEELAFSWWIPQVLQKKARIIVAVNKRYHKRTHKFGIWVPKTVWEALDLDKTNGNDLWWEAIKKEMKAVKIAFKILGNDEKSPPGSQFMKCRMIFDIKMEDFRRKARLVAGGHMMETLKTLTYASVVSQETVRIALMVATLNDVEVKTSYVQNVYLTAPCAEVIHTTLGTEFGEDEGKTGSIVRALYGLTSAGASFRNHLADCM